MQASRAMLIVLLAQLSALAVGLCPFSSSSDNHAYNNRVGWPVIPPGYSDALNALDFDAVKADIRAMFKQSKSFWPADYGNYGPLFVRLAWHNSGSYRTSDGRGGADGGRQRFEPERSWEDNTNLDKARALLWPIKQKYGLGLSWGDLIILSGNEAIESMGGPILGFCAGRIDDPNGDWSAELGPTPEQEAVAPCPVNGECEVPLGSTTVGLIYLNPEGPMGQPIPEKSALDVRDSFGRMAMNDSETVALIGGGHAFGKTHGACPEGPGPAPNQDPINPWPGMCGSGKGADAYTSGFEGPWTTQPTTWDNEYFQNLVNHEWSKFQGPGGKWMWRPNGTNPVAPSPTGEGTQHIMMMTSDISLKHDPSGEYQKIIAQFAQDLGAFDNAFAHAWYKLTTRDMGPITRCHGKDVPPAQPWQNPLPAPPTKVADFAKVKTAVQAVLGTDHNFDVGSRLVRLAWSCGSTFRVTDYLGGCNGARLRFSPQKDFKTNVALDTTLAKLEAIQRQFGGLSWADLIVLAGNTALEAAGGVPMPFCGGRTDADGGTASDAYLEPRVTGNSNDTLVQMRDYYKVMGLTVAEYVALAARPVDEDYYTRLGFMTSGRTTSTKLSNEYYKTLLSEDWELFTGLTGMQQYKAKDKELYMLKTDVLIRYDPELMAMAQNYAADNSAFLKQFSAAWTKLMNADRFGTSVGESLCDQKESLVKPF